MKFCDCFQLCMGPFLLVGKYCKMHLELMVVLMSGQWCGTPPTCLQLVTPILHLESGTQQVLAHSTAHCCSLKHMNSCGKRRISRRYTKPKNILFASLVYLFRAVPKLVAFLLPIFRNVDGSWHVTSKLRGSTLIQVAQGCSKVFQKFSASLVRVWS